MSNSATKDIDAMALGCSFFEVLCRKQLCEVIHQLDGVVKEKGGAKHID